jgi:hypothetical protein
VDAANGVFTVLFALEIILRTMAWGARTFFSHKWNCFEAFIVLAGVIVLICDNAIIDSFDTGSLGIVVVMLRVTRVVLRVIRFIKFVRRLKNMQRLLETVIFALPSLANVGALLFLLGTVYSILGKSLFANVKHQTYITDHANFRSFGTAMVTLFRMLTGEKWNGIMHDCMSGLCEDLAISEGCGGTLRAASFFLSYTVLGGWIMLNLFVAIILDNFGESDKLAPFSRESVQIYKTVWSQYDHAASLRLKLSDLMGFLQTLGPPLGLPNYCRVEEVSKKLLTLKHCRITVIHPLSDNDSYVMYGDLFRALAAAAAGLKEEPQLSGFFQARLNHARVFQKSGDRRSSLPLVKASSGEVDLSSFTLAEWHAAWRIQCLYRNFARLCKMRRELATIVMLQTMCVLLWATADACRMRSCVLLRLTMLRSQVPIQAQPALPEIMEGSL